MQLTPREKDKLLIAMAAVVARKRLERGVKLNYPEAVALMTRNPHPGTLIAALADAGLARDAVHALALMLPHRQVVWWACLAVRAIPDLDRRPADHRPILQRQDDRRR